jgi:hypothetical protein
MKTIPVRIKLDVYVITPLFTIQAWNSSIYGNKNNTFDNFYDTKNKYIMHKTQDKDLAFFIITLFTNAEGTYFIHMCETLV